MKAIAKPISQSDSTLAKNLKKKLRGVKNLEREIEQIKAQATQTPESEPKVTLNELDQPLSDFALNDQITLTPNQEQNQPIAGDQPILDITRYTANSSRLDLPSEQDPPQIDSAITDQSPTTFRRCCDKLAGSLWNLLTGATTTQSRVDSGQDREATGSQATLSPSNQIRVQPSSSPTSPTGEQPSSSPTSPTGEQLASTANSTLATDSSQIAPLQEKELAKTETNQHSTTLACPSLANISPSVDNNHATVTFNIAVNGTTLQDQNFDTANNFIVLDYSQDSTAPNLLQAHPSLLEVEPIHKQLIILDRQLPCTTAQNTETALGKLGDKALEKELGVTLPLSRQEVTLQKQEQGPQELSESIQEASGRLQIPSQKPQEGDSNNSLPEGECPTSHSSKTSPTKVLLEQAYEREEKINSSYESNEYIQVLTGYTDAIRSLLQARAKAPFRLAGINIYEQLQEIEDALAECLEYKSDSVLNKLLSMTRSREELRSDYERIRRQQELVCGVAEVLDVESNGLGDCSQTGSEVAQSVQDLMDYYAELAVLYPEDQSVIAHIRARTSEWGGGLFYCYEERGSPRTNNSLEQYNDVLKRQRRRVTGQKNVADYIIRHGPYAIFHDPDDQPDDILARFQNVSIKTLKKEQAAFHAATRCSRNIRSFRRDSKSYLNKLKALWFKGAP